MPEKKDFIIKDKRIFSEDGPEQKEKEDAEARISEEEASTEKVEENFQLPEINFATFIFSLNSSGLVQLGIIEDPATGQKTKNLAIAKQTIDILGMLEEKTRGNLTKDEENMLKNILYDLRMIYIKEKE
jgi:hypothetical protein